jgi:peptidoglycan/xylan/chitin deacetylase (PgdA/CDA1 family)
MLFAETWYTVVAPTVAMVGGVVCYGIVHPRSQLMGRVLYRADPTQNGDSPRAALTFDDGPTPDSTPAVLQALRDVDAKATFFVIGENAARYPDLLREIYSDGHLIANHTFAHHRQGLWGRHVYWRQQMETTGDLIVDLIGQRPAIFRPPMGYKHWHLMYQARTTGHTVVNWSRRARDGGRRTTARKIVKLLAGAEDGEVLLLHDGHEPDRSRSRRPTAEAVIPLVNQLRDRGLELVTLDELFGIEGYQ